MKAPRNSSTPIMMKTTISGVRSIAVTCRRSPSVAPEFANAWLNTSEPAMMNKIMVVELGTFREDLFYRLNVIPLEIPPLRDRQGDIRMLAQHFLKKYCDENSKKISGFSAEAFEKLETYSWPGNVRELENCVERVVVLAAGDIIDEGDLLLSGPRRDGVVDATVDALFDGPLTLDELERQILLTSLERCGGNLSRTARTLGMTRRALQYRAEKIKGSTNEPTGDDEPDQAHER